MELIRVEIKKLFGRFDYEISLKRPEKITIIHAPNGFGKTAILTLVNAFFSKNMLAFFKVNFEFMLLVFDNGETIQIRRAANEGLFANNSPKDLQNGDGPVVITSSVDPLRVHQVSPMRDLSEIIPFLESAGSDLWQDQRDGEFITTSEAFSRYAPHVPAAMRQSQELPDWLLTLTEKTDCRLIETQRLLRIGAARTSNRRRRPTTAVVDMEAQDLAERIGQNLVLYATGSQRLDQSFPKRLISALNTGAPTTEEVTSRLQTIEAKRKVLIEAGLIDKTGAPEILSAAELASQEVRRVMALYLNDMDEKLSKFDDLYARISLFQELISEKFQFKKVLVSREHGMSVRTDEGLNVPLSNLSSGEQHELVMLYDLLFKIKDDALILIDEPELSLHVGWQVQFLPDLQRIQKLKPLQIILATHSPQIINDRWDLTVELKR